MRDLSGRVKVLWVAVAVLVGVAAGEGVLLARDGAPAPATVPGDAGDATAGRVRSRDLFPDETVCALGVRVTAQDLAAIIARNQPWHREFVATHDIPAEMSVVLQGLMEEYVGGLNSIRVTELIGLEDTEAVRARYKTELDATRLGAQALLGDELGALFMGELNANWVRLWQELERANGVAGPPLRGPEEGE